MLQGAGGIRAGGVVLVVHAYTYDSAGRLSIDDADTQADPLPAGVDSAVVKLGRAYDDLGRLQTVTSYDNENTVVNEVEVTFGAWGNVTESVQDHAGAVGGGEPAVTYTYEDGGPGSGEAKYVRLDKIAYPGAGREVYYNYPTIDTEPGYWLSRLANTASAASPTDAQKFAEYTYLGAGTVVEVKYPAVTVSTKPLVLTYGTGGAYPGFDRFGRIENQKWEIKDAEPDNVKDQFAYGYDRASNRTWREVAPDGDDPTGFDEYYTYDGLHRLEKAERGTLDGASITNHTKRQDFGLEALGNWRTFNEDAGPGGPGQWDLEQVRLHNKVNEIDNDDNHANDPDDDTITEGDGQSAWLTPKFDATGNMIEGSMAPRAGVANPEQTRHKYAYDAWNRLAQVKNNSDTILATYRYDGLNRRIRKLLGSNPASPTTAYDYYYSGYRVVEVRKDEDTDPYEQYVWDIRYVHSPVLRWRDTTSPPDGNVDETLYYTNDANFNVTALVEPDGDVVERVVYDPYGKATFYDGSWANPSSTSAYANDVLYTGHRLDSETGLYYAGARYYHPTLGRWVSWDPSGYADGMSLYEYVRSTPLVAADFTGLRSWITKMRCWSREKLIRAFLNDQEGKRAWDRFTSGTGYDIHLSDGEMKDLLDVSENTQNFLDNLELLCNTGANWSWRTDTLTEDYDKPTRWDEAIGHAHDVQVATKCEECCLGYRVYLQDYFDFTPRWIEKLFTDKPWRKPWAEVQVSMVWLAQQMTQCQWKEFCHRGQISGTRGTCSSGAE